MPTKKSPQASGMAKGAEHSHLKGSSKSQAMRETERDFDVVAKIFASLAGLPRWIPYALIPKKSGEGYDKIPNNGRHNLSYKDSDNLGTLSETIKYAQQGGLSGVGFVMGEKLQHDGYRLIGIDIDKADEEGAASFLETLDCYAEHSPSGNGYRMFAFVPEEWAAQYRDTVDAKPDFCDHMEIYMGTGWRFLTVTFNPVQTLPIGLLDEKQCQYLAQWLKPAEVTNEEKNTTRMIELGQVDKEVMHKHLSLAALDPDYLKLRRGEALPWMQDMSRSGFDFAFSFVLSKLGFGVDEIAAQLLHYEYGKAAERRDPEKYISEILEKVQSKKETGVKSNPLDEEVRFDFRPLTLEVLQEPIPPRQFVITPHLPCGVLVEFSGAHGISKSTLRLIWLSR